MPRPNFFIAGAPRCGTSSLHAYLQYVPGVFMSKIKEPNFYSRAVVGERNPMVKPIRSLRRYLRLFRDAGDAQVIGEATPFYLEDPQAPLQIDHDSPDAKILLSLRDPVERLHSHYLMMRNNRRRMGSFLDEIRRGITLEGDPDLAILTPSTGLYSRHVSRYRAVFGKERLKVLVLEEWRGNVLETLRDVLGFLGIEHDLQGLPVAPQRRFAEARGPLVRYLFGNRVIQRASETLVPFRLRRLIRESVLVRHVPKPPMEIRAREFLTEYYWNDVRQLERLLGRSMPWRNFAREDEARVLRPAAVL